MRHCVDRHIQPAAAVRATRGGGGVVSWARLLGLLCCCTRTHLTCRSACFDQSLTSLCPKTLNRAAGCHRALAGGGAGHAHRNGQWGCAGRLCWLCTACSMHAACMAAAEHPVLLLSLGLLGCAQCAACSSRTCAVGCAVGCEVDGAWLTGAVEEQGVLREHGSCSRSASVPWGVRCVGKPRLAH